MNALYILCVETAVRRFARQDEMRSGRWSGLELLRKSYEMQAARSAFIPTPDQSRPFATHHYSPIASMSKELCKLPLDSSTRYVSSGVDMIASFLNLGVEESQLPDNKAKPLFDAELLLYCHAPRRRIECHTRSQCCISMFPLASIQCSWVCAEQCAS
jgi:hypothetical protein